MIGIAIIFYLGVIFLMIASMWKIFEKAGEKGWKAIIPIYNLVVLLQIVGKPDWWIVFMLLVPIANIVFMIWTYNMLSKSFGKDEGFTVGLILLGIVFFPVLAFGDAEYQGPYGTPEAFQAYRKKLGQGQFDFDHSL
ncbi:MAG: hypothetical protein BGO31_17500 [Bacteroidetes bacterium 43-16]|nr:MAG: hypothetical protein BGO31_17500 [Bacteroidetes bacterium 43-16]